MNVNVQLRKIKTINCVEELLGYIQQAKKRGLLAEEVQALAERERFLGKAGENGQFSD